MPGPVVELVSKKNCRYCDYAKDLLWSHGVRFRETNLTDLYGDDVPQMKKHLRKLKTGSETVPQIFVDGVYQGGYSEFARKVRGGELVLNPARTLRFCGQ